MRSVPPRFGFGSGEVNTPASVAEALAAALVAAGGWVAAAAGVGRIARVPTAVGAAACCGGAGLPHAARNRAIVLPANPSALSRATNCRRLSRRAWNASNTASVC